MKTINLNFVIKKLDGTPMPGLSNQSESLTAGELVGNQLVAQTKGDALKFYDWAVAMSSGKDIIVDASDFKKIYDFVKDSDQMFIISKAQIMRYLDGVKDSE